MAEAVSSRWARPTDPTPPTQSSRGRRRPRGGSQTPRTPKQNLLPQKTDDQPAKTTNNPRRRRQVPPAISTHPPSSIDPTPGPASARSTSSNNARLRPHHGRPRTGIAPSATKALASPSTGSAPLKDTPPHLSQKPSVRTEIDALVEHVRAVAMDHPSTPRTGSHIDWAGDDDDSLPDLDDWGVNTASLNSMKSEAISPIVVDGLKQLPDVSLPTSVPASPPIHQPPTPLEPSPAPGPDIIKQDLVNERPPEDPPKIPASPGPLPTSPIVENPSQPVSAMVDLVGKSCTDQYFETRGGLSESIHAPKGPVNPISAPPDVSTYAEARNNPRRRQGPGHMRAQTVGRPAPPAQQQQQQQQAHNPNRGTRGNPRHSRNYSSPASSPSTQRRPPHTHRPVINADALTRLARQIGQTSSPKQTTTGSGSGDPHGS